LPTCSGVDPVRGGPFTSPAPGAPNHAVCLCAAPLGVCREPLPLVYAPRVPTHSPSLSGSGRWQRRCRFASSCWTVCTGWNGPSCPICSCSSSRRCLAERGAAGPPQLTTALAAACRRTPRDATPTAHTPAWSLSSAAPLCSRWMSCASSPRWGRLMVGERGGWIWMPRPLPNPYAFPPAVAASSGRRCSGLNDAARMRARVHVGVRASCGSVRCLFVYDQMSVWLQDVCRDPCFVEVRLPPLRRCLGLPSWLASPDLYTVHCALSPFPSLALPQPHPSRLGAGSGTCHS
jgi:hypothetical protein